MEWNDHIDVSKSFYLLSLNDYRGHCLITDIIYKNNTMTYFGPMMEIGMLLVAQNRTLGFFVLA